MLSYFKDKCLLTFVYLKQHIVTYYNIANAKLIGFQELHIINENKVQNVAYKYIIYLFITKYINFIKSIRNCFDIDTKCLHVVKLCSTHRNAKILINHPITFKYLTTHLNESTEETMLDAIIFKFDLINDSYTADLKNLIMKYRDTNNNYHHSIRNILLFNNIHFNDESTLNIKLMKNKKMVIKNISLRGISDQHINYFLC
jgi:hypothetical protein